MFDQGPKLYIINLREADVMEVLASEHRKNVSLALLDPSHSLRLFFALLMARSLDIQ